MLCRAERVSPGANAVGMEWRCHRHRFSPSRRWVLQLLYLGQLTFLLDCFGFFALIFLVLGQSPFSVLRAVAKDNIVAGCLAELHFKCTV